MEFVSLMFPQQCTCCCKVSCIKTKVNECVKKIIKIYYKVKVHSARALHTIKVKYTNSITCCRHVIEGLADQISYLHDS